MANIGSFKKAGNDFQGEIITLSLQAKNVRIVPEENRSNENAPSHRIFVGRAEIGAAWSKRSEEGRDYLSLPQARRSLVHGPDLRKPFRRSGRRRLHPHLVAEPEEHRLKPRSNPAWLRSGGVFVAHAPRQ